MPEPSTIVIGSSSIKLCPIVSSTTGLVFVSPIMVLRPALSKLVSIAVTVLLVLAPSAYIVSPRAN